MAATKSRVCIVSAFSTYNLFQREEIRIKTNEKTKQQGIKKLHYIATTDQRDKDGGNNDNGPKHNQIMLKAKNDPFSCNQIKDKKKIGSANKGWQKLSLDREKGQRGGIYAMRASW